MTQKTWFMTGASRGFGRIWAEAALVRGDRVAATARRAASLAGLAERFGNSVLPLELDVTDAVQVERGIAAAHQHFGRLDVVVNNAGYALVGTIEESSEADVRAVFETNFYGALRVIKAVLPFLRAQGTGHIVGVSSGLGILAPPAIGFYSATKWAFEALHESLAQEIKGFGIKVTLLEPGAYATGFSTDHSLRVSPELDIYESVREPVRARLCSQKRGDPRATAEAVLQVVDAAGPPLRLLLGSSILPAVRAVYADRLATWSAWEDVSNAAQGNQTRE